MAARCCGALLCCPSPCPALPPQGKRHVLGVPSDLQEPSVCSRRATGAHGYHASEHQRPSRQGVRLAPLYDSERGRTRMMKKALCVSVTACVALCGAVSAWATGNGAPSGAHYNLNIICVPQAKTADMTDTQGHTLFVPCEGSTKIYLIEGDDFAVLDRNGTDANGASFQLPPTDTGVITDQPGVHDACTL